MSDDLKIKITPEMDFDDAKAAFEQFINAARRLKGEAAEMDRAFVRAAASAAKMASPDASIGSVRESERFLRQQVSPVMGNGPLTPERLRQRMPNPPSAMAGVVDAFSARHDNEQARRDANERERENREVLTFLKNEPEGIAARYDSGIRNRVDRGTIQRQREKRFLDSDEGKIDEASRANYHEYVTQRGNLIRGQMRGAARQQAAADLGISLPEDIHPFARLLQNTFKSATSLGMLEALSGGSAAPLARALAMNVIGGAILNPAMQTLGSMGGGVAKAGGTFSSAAGNAIGSIAGRFGLKAGSAAAGADAAGGAAAGAEGAAGSGAMGLLAGAGGVAALVAGVALVAGGLALGYSSQVGNKNSLEQQLWAASGGKAANQPDQFIDQAIGSSSRYLYHNKDVAGVMTGLANTGVLAGQDLRSNTDNALILSRLTNKGPGDFTSLVGSLAQGGAGPNEITKMIQLMTVQNSLTKDQRIPLDTMVENLQVLVQGAGIIPTNAGTVAGLAAVSHALAGQGAAGRAPGLAGQVLAPLMGAVGMQAISAEGLLGMSPDQFAKAQKSPTVLWNALSGFLQQNVGPGSKDQRLQSAEAIMQALPMFGAQGMDPAKLSAYASGLLTNNPAAMEANAQKFLGAKLAPTNEFKAAVAKTAQMVVSLGEQGIIDMENNVLHETQRHSEQLTTIIGLLGGKTPSGSGGAPTAAGVAAQHGGQPTWQPRTNSFIFPDGTVMAARDWNLLNAAPKGPPSAPSANLPLPPGSLGPGKSLKGSIKGVNIDPAMLREFALASANTGIPMATLIAQAYQESTLNPNAVGPSTRYGTAKGLMQFMPETARWITTVKNVGDVQNPLYGKKFDPFNARQAIEEGAFYDAYLKAQNGGNLNAGLEQYSNGQPGYAADIAKNAQNVSVTVVVEDKTQHGVTVKHKDKAKGAH